MSVRRALPGIDRPDIDDVESEAKVFVFAAGSLSAAFTDLAHAFGRISGHRVALTFGASGLLRERIASGERVDVFASANMEHPRSLRADGWAECIDVLVRNRMCVLAAPDIRATPDTVLDAMLDPGVRLGTSTPGADPSGDYAWEVFRKADALRPGAFSTLSAKALQLVGGPTAAPPSQRGSVYGMLVSKGMANVFLTYRTSAELSCRQFPKLRVIELPEPLAVGADYGVAMRGGAPSPAREFVAYLRWTEAQRVLAAYGFDPP